MRWYVLAVLMGAILDVLRILRMTGEEKDLEILLLRQQLMIVRRKQQRGPTVTRLEKLILVQLVRRLTGMQCRAKETIARHVLIFKPETIIGWIVNWYARSGRMPGRDRAGDDHGLTGRWKC
jgi:hypothetical protein